MALKEAPYLSYAVAQAVTQTAQTEIMGQIDAFLALLPDSANGTPGSTDGHDFDAIRPEVEVAIRRELTALKAAIDAAPTS